MQEPDAEGPDVDDAEPSFGDLMVASSTTGYVDVETSLGGSHEPPRSLEALSRSEALPVPSATSLGTVLGQALRTDDVQLLESCLHVSDIPAIRATIQRLDSSLATALLSKLADRMHRRPARAGTLMVWIQWTLVSHGGYLIGQPELMRKLAAFHKVLTERASGLQPLLALKGKLDMLEAQLQLRKGLKDSAGGREPGEEEDERVIYVEGEDESHTDDDADAVNALPLTDLADFSSQDDDDDEMPTTANGIIDDADAMSQESESDDEDMIDDEAEETDAESGDDDEEDEDDDSADHNADPAEVDILDVAAKNEGPRPSSKRPAMVERGPNISTKRRR